MIYNEVSDVMRSIMHMFTKKKEEDNKKKSLVSALNAKSAFEMMKGDDEVDEDLLYIIEKDLIIEAWSKYRPDASIPNTPRLA